jgi:hypothetical protein
MTLAAFGSNESAAEVDVPDDDGTDAPEGVGVVGSGVSSGGEPVRMGNVEAAGEQPARARMTATKAVPRIRDIGRC